MMLKISGCDDDFLSSFSQYKFRLQLMIISQQTRHTLIVDCVDASPVTKEKP